MCRSTETEFDNFHVHEQNRLKIKAIYIRLRGPKAPRPLPNSLPLVFLPRISENSLQIDSTEIKPNFPAIVTLHRVVSAGEATFGSRERVLASEGLRFEVYFEKERMLKGTFRKSELEEWKIECKCSLEREKTDVSEVEVCALAEGKAPMNERVEVVAGRKRGFEGLLEEIPEMEKEEEDDCCGCEDEDGAGRDWEEEWGKEIETGMAGVRWAVDVGIWVISLGVGIILSRASSNTLRRRRIM